MSFRSFFSFCCFLYICSCQSTQAPQQEIRGLLASSQFTEAADRHREYRNFYQDELLYQLNQSSLEYYKSIYLRGGRAPNFERAEELLRYDDKKIASFAWQVKSQTVRGPYSPSLPESLWHNLFASLYYWNQGSGMLVELRRSQEKEALFIQLQNSGFHSSALLQYLGMIYYRGHNADDWRINRAALLELTSESSYYPRAFPEARLPARDFSQGFEKPSGIINFCVFTGQGVRKVAQSIRVIKVPGGLGIQFDNGLDAELELGFSRIVLPNLDDSFSYYQMQIPVMQALENRVRRIVVRVDGELRKELYPLEPFTDIRMAEFRRLRAVFLPEQITGFILKVVASELLQKGARSSNENVGFIGALAGSLLVNISAPVPNLRTVGFYPSLGWVGELKLAGGPHQVDLEYHSEEGLLNQKSFELVVEEGKTLILQDYYAR